jgi:hypothetical protein
MKRKERNHVRATRRCGGGSSARSRLKGARFKRFWAAALQRRTSRRADKRELTPEIRQAALLTRGTTSEVTRACPRSLDRAPTRLAGSLGSAKESIFAACTPEQPCVDASHGPQERPAGPRQNLPVRGAVRCDSGRRSPVPQEPRIRGLMQRVGKAAGTRYILIDPIAPTETDKGPTPHATER